MNCRVTERTLRAGSVVKVRNWYAGSVGFQTVLLVRDVPIVTHLSGAPYVVIYASDKHVNFSYHHNALVTDEFEVICGEIVE
jgi:hypothetical protein